LAKKVEKRKTFPVVFSLRFFSIAFLAVSLHEEPKNTTKTFSKIRLENLKQFQKKVPWHLPRLFFSPGAPWLYTRGQPKKSTDSPVHLLNPKPTHPPFDFFVHDFFFPVRFWAFLGQGSAKTPLKYFCKKSMSNAFSKQNRQKFRCQFFLDFFWLYRVFGCFSAMGVKKTPPKTLYEKHRVEKFLQKIQPKIHN
jgi:hypothetical protein